MKALLTMKALFRSVAVIAAAAVLYFSAPSVYVFAQSAGVGDVTSVIGSLPWFPNGLRQDQYGIQFKQIVDSTPTTPAPVGKIVYWTGSSWIQAATANVALGRGMYGVVTVAAQTQGGTATIQTQGLVTASVKTGGSVACAATGDVPLAITTTGDLTPTAAATVPGVTWGTCASVLAISQSATLISIVVGGY